MIEVITGGLQTTVQDLGRRGAMHLGIGHSGVMDTLSAISANRLVGMDDNNPVLECTLVGPSLKFHDDMLIAICGSDMTFTLQQQAIQQNRPIAVSKGTTLTFKSNHLGARAYIAFSKTMDIQPVLGSVATHLGAGIGGLNGRALMKGDKIQFIDVQPQAKADIDRISTARYAGHYQIRYTSSPESNNFSAAQLEHFVKQKYQVTKEFNRMGIRLTGRAINFAEYPSMLSKGLLPGAIQIPPDGLPIIAGKDAQTTGGYVRIGQIIQADLPIIGQLQTNDEIQFQAISLSDAMLINQTQAELL